MGTPHRILSDKLQPRWGRASDQTVPAPFTEFVSLLALELANENTGAFFFVEDQAFIAASSLTRAMILERPTFDPHSAAVEQ